MTRDRHANASKSERDCADKTDLQGSHEQHAVQIGSFEFWRGIRNNSAGFCKGKAEDVFQSSWDQKFGSHSAGVTKNSCCIVLEVSWRITSDRKTVTGSEVLLRQVAMTWLIFDAIRILTSKTTKYQSRTKIITERGWRTSQKNSYAW